MRDNLFKLRNIFLEVVENLLSLGRIGAGHMFLDHFFQFLNIIFAGQLVGGHHFLVEADVEIVSFIQHIGDASAHSGGKVLSGAAKNHHAASGHVFAAMIAHAFHYGRTAGVADGKAFSRHAVHEDFSACGSVQGHVSDDDVILCCKTASLRRINDQLSAGKTFSEIVVAVSDQLQGQSFGNERAEALSAGAVAADAEGIILQSRAEFSGDLRSQDGSEGTVCVGHVNLHAAAASRFQSLGKLLQEHPLVQCLFQAEVIDLFRIEAHILPSLVRVVQDGADIDFPEGRRQILLHAQQVGTAHQLIHAPDAQLCHVLSQLLSDETHEIDHVFRFSAESLSQLRVLGSDADRTGVQVADTHHDAAHGHKGRRGKAEFLRAQDGRDGHIPSAHQLAVRLNAHPLAQSVFNQSLLGFRKAQLPGKSRVVDGASGSGSRSSVIAGDQDDLGARLGDACRNRSHALFTHQLYGNPRFVIGVFQVVNELGQILDGVNVMVRRRGNQAHAGRGMAGFRDPRVHLSAGQMAALSGLCSLRHLNLDFLGAHQIFAGHAEPSAGHLLDGGAAV